MMKLNTERVVRGLALVTAILLSQNLVAAEYGSSPESLLSAAGASLSTTPAAPKSDSFSEIVESVRQLGVKQELNQEEIERRAKLEKWTKEDDAIQANRNDLERAKAKKTQELEAKHQADQALFAQVQATPIPGVNSADTDLSGLEASCTNNVNTSGFKSLADEIQTKPFQDLTTALGSLFDKESKELKKKRIQDIQNLTKAIQESAKDDLSPEEKEVINSEPTLDMSEFELVKRLKRLESATEEKKDSANEGAKALAGELAKFAAEFDPLTGSSPEQEKKMRQAAAQFSAKLEAHRKGLADRATTSLKNLKQNCDTVKKEARKQADQGMYWASILYGRNAQADAQKNQAKAAEVQESLDKVKCTANSNVVEDQLGAAMQQRIQQLASVTDRQALLMGAVSVVQALGNAGAEVAKAFPPLKQACQLATKTRDNLKGLAKNAQAQVAQGPFPAAPGVVPPSVNPAGRH